MSRLESMIRRLTAQRAAIDWAVEAVRDLAGDVLEVGLGNGRTYDHLRSRAPERRVWVIERTPNPHPACWPPRALLLEGEAEAGLARLAAEPRLALVHYDLGTGDADAARAEAERLTPLCAKLLAPGGVLLSVQPTPPIAGMERVDAAAIGAGGRIDVLRRMAACAGE